MTTSTPATSLPRFAFDENLSLQLAQAMQLLDSAVDVKHTTELFGLGAEDPDFLPKLGAEVRFLVTRDTRQRKRPAELDAWKRHSVGAFVLGGKNLDAWALVTQVVLGWPKMKEAAAKTTRPFAYRVRPAGGKLEPLSL